MMRLNLIEPYHVMLMNRLTHFENNFHDTIANMHESAKSETLEVPISISMCVVVSSIFFIHMYCCSSFL